jgi:hypothetical protein
MRPARGTCAASPHHGIWLLNGLSIAAQLNLRHGCIPTYCAAVGRAHDIVLIELKVLVKHGRVELHFAVELVADLLPVGGWLRHGYRDIMARCWKTPCWRRRDVMDLGISSRGRVVGLCDTASSSPHHLHHP